MSLDGEKYVVKIPYGSTSIPKSQVEWVHTSPKVNSYYIAGRLAHSQKKYEVAVKFYQRSIQKEPTTKTNAQKYLNSLNASLKELQALKKVDQIATRSFNDTQTPGQALFDPKNIKISFHVKEDTNKTRKNKKKEFSYTHLNVKVEVKNNNSVQMKDFKIKLRVIADWENIKDAYKIVAEFNRKLNIGVEEEVELNENATYRAAEINGDDYGADYKGVIAYIYDENGIFVTAKASSTYLSKHIEPIKDFQNHTIYTRDFNIIQQQRNFQGKKMK